VVLSPADRAKFSGMSARRSSAESALRRIDRIVSAVEEAQEASSRGSGSGELDADAAGRGSPVRARSEEGAHVES
jgi:hypothetical protein